MTYKIVSERIGKPGDDFTPDEGVNVEALLAHGLIVEADKPKKTKPESE